jgi:hypothetical protein
MVWLAKWIRENRPKSRVLIITDRTELDEQIEKVFKGVSEADLPHQERRDLIDKLNGTEESLLCSLVHKFGGKGNGEEEGEGTKAFIESLQKLPPGFSGQGRPPCVRGRVPPHPERRPAQGHEGDPAQCDVHRLYRHAAAEGRQGRRASRSSAATSTPTSSTRRCARAWCWTCATRRGTSTSADQQGQDRPVVRGQDQGPERPGQGAAQAEVGHHAAGAVQPGPAGEDRRRHPAGHERPSRA